MELARWRSLASASGVALGVKIGGVLRGVLPRSSALRASGGGARGNAVRGSSPRAQPRLRSALIPTRYAVGTRLRASFKSAVNGGFPTPLVRPRLPRPFFGQNRSLLGLWRPPRPNFAQKTASEGAARPPATRPECPATRETRGHLLNGGLPARRGLWTAPGTVPTARGASGLGSRPMGAPRHGLSIL